VVSGDSDSLLEAGDRALEAGEWLAARSSFEAALELEETPEALLGLGNALWWLDETEASLRSRERAYAAFRHRPDPFQAAVTALQLAYHYGANLGDVPAARGWGARAARLVEEFELAALEGWVLLSQAPPRAGIRTWARGSLVRRARTRGAWATTTWSCAR
jgi:tetratricopeptide (TPR) repeat protein